MFENSCYTLMYRDIRVYVCDNVLSRMSATQNNIGIYNVIKRGKLKENTFIIGIGKNTDTCAYKHRLTKA